MDSYLYSLDSMLDFLGLKSAGGIQAAYNSALVEREKTGLNLNDFIFDEAQVKYTFEQLELDGHLNAMASIVAYGSEPDTIGKSVSFRKATGTIPRQRLKITRDEENYRDMLEAMNDVRSKAALKGVPEYSSIYGYLSNNLFDTLAQFTDGHNGLVNNMIGKVLSTGGYEVNADNNPQAAYMTYKFDANIPTANKITEAWWTKDANGNITYVTTVDPIKVLWKRAREIRDNVLGNGYENIKLRVGRKTFYDFIEHPTVKTAIGYALNGNLRLSKDNDKNAVATAEYAIYHDTEEALVNVVKRLIGVDELQLENTICVTTKWDATAKKFVNTKHKAFEEDVIVLTPTGTVGLIKNVMPVRPDASAIAASIFEGRGILEYRYDAQFKVQTWVSELTVLPVLNAPSKVYIYNVVGETKADDEENEGENS